MSDEYIPIDCDLYSRYELAILHHQALKVAWRDSDGNPHLQRLLPLDLNTRQHVEYLRVRTEDDQILELRLDRIIRAEPC
ncbi:MAG TPA: transcriptional antiterminator, Rof [Candidatus Competibacteraceae bacterium]|nr:transcriptional antiterminator, Rof [Candidatus Competibacteraceae bacterium]